MKILKDLKRRLGSAKPGVDVTSAGGRELRDQQLVEPNVEEILAKGSVQPDEWYILYNHAIENPKDRRVLRFIADLEYGQGLVSSGVGTTALKAEAGQLKFITVCPSCWRFLRTDSNRCPKCGLIKDPLEIPLKEVTAYILPGGEMELVPAGTFMMGSQADEEGRFANETLHEVKITRSFLMGKTPVTQMHWTFVMKRNPSHFKGYNLPVESVSWNDTIDFCNRLSKREEFTPAYRINGDNVTWNKGADGYRLPTEAEWEHACRAGTTTIYNTGSSFLDLGWTGWYEDNSRSKTHPVGKKSPNVWGLYDMHGNVWEWCWDSYEMYPSNPVTDPAGAASGFYRVVRGGSWNSNARLCRSSARRNDPPGRRFDNFGLRLVRPAR